MIILNIWVYISNRLLFLHDDYIFFYWFLCGFSIFVIAFIVFWIIIINLITFIFILISILLLILYIFYIFLLDFLFHLTQDNFKWFHWSSFNHFFHNHESIFCLFSGNIRILPYFPINLILLIPFIFNQKINNFLINLFWIIIKEYLK